MHSPHFWSAKKHSKAIYKVPQSSTIQHCHASLHSPRRERLSSTQMQHRYSQVISNREEGKSQSITRPNILGLLEFILKIRYLLKYHPSSNTDGNWEQVVIASEISSNGVNLAKKKNLVTFHPEIKRQKRMIFYLNFFFFFAWWQFF